MPDPVSTATRLSKQFASTLGTDLRSVVLFGSVARGESIPGISDVNVMVLLESVTADHLIQTAPLAQQWVRAGNTPPHVFSWEEWTGMGDTFAIEIADMLDAREIIHGVDPVASLSPDRSDLRLHTEHEIRETMLHLRLRLLLVANHPRELGSLLLSGLPSFSAYMRAALRLDGQDAPLETGSAIELAARLVDADPGAMLDCHEARRAQRPLSVRVTDPLVASYIEFLRRLVAFIDGLPPRNAVPSSSAALAGGTLSLPPRP